MFPTLCAGCRAQLVNHQTCLINLTLELVSGPHVPVDAQGSSVPQCDPRATSNPRPVPLQVFYNNVLSLPLLCLVAFVNGEFTRIASEPALFNRGEDDIHT